MSTHKEIYIQKDAFITGGAVFVNAGNAFELKLTATPTASYTLTLPPAVGSINSVVTQVAADGTLAYDDSPKVNSIQIGGASTFFTTFDSAATADRTITFPATESAFTASAGSILQATDTSGTLTWTESPTLTNLTLTGDLTVSGTTTTINTATMLIEDNLILLNSGEGGAGVTEGSAGIEIDRGSLTNAILQFDETNDVWQTGLLAGTFYDIVHKANGDASTSGAIPGWDANGRLATTSGLAAAEVTQLQNIDAVTISNTQWGYLGAMDQGVGTGDTVTFANLTVTGTLTATVASAVSATLTADPAPVPSGFSIYDTSGGAFAATLPTATSVAGTCFILYLTADGNDLTITAAGTDEIEGDATIVLKKAGQHVELCSLGVIGAIGTWVLR